MCVEAFHHPQAQPTTMAQPDRFRFSSPNRDPSAFPLSSCLSYDSFLAIAAKLHTPALQS